MTKRLILRLGTLVLCAAALTQPRAAESQDVPAPAPPPASETLSPPPGPPAPSADPLTMLPHSDTSRFYVAGQANIIFQAHPGFHSPYSDTNSLLARGEYKVSLLGTLYLGYQLFRSDRYDTELLYNEESSGGRGISQALGLAGFTNLDVVRNPSLGSVPYTARVQLHQVIGLTGKTADAERSFTSLATKLPVRRLDLRVGKLSLPDVMDINDPGSDSHLQFLNWTVDNNGAWDYAADTRGYTYGVVAEYDDHAYSARYIVALMPVVANGVDLQWNLRRARGDNYELEDRDSPLARLLARFGDRTANGAPRDGTIRVLGYVNHANMGVYRQQNALALRARALGLPGTMPDITAHPPQVTVKYGVGLNLQQEVADGVRVFGRFGWNEGQHESYAYTEDDQTFEGGLDVAGTHWSRAHDKAGLALVSNAIKRDHQQYLALGGLGFLLGDGKLNYAREDILESYYNAHVWRGLFSAFDVQLIAHPGYNQDRGPVAVFSVRSHVDF